jgi:amino acid adenylation domain-containing protein
MTYAVLDLRIREWVGVLNSLGVGRNDRVALVLPDGPATAVASLGVASAATCAPLNPGFRRAEFEAHFQRIRPQALVVSNDGNPGAMEAARSQGIPVWKFCGREGPIEVDGKPLSRRIDGGWARPGDTALLLPTSGTSASPKYVPLTHRNVCFAAQGIRAALELSGADRCLNVMPLFHIHGLSLLYASLAAGGSVVCPPGFDAGSFPGWLRSSSATWYSAAPSIHRMILDAVRHHPDLPATTELRFVRSASAPMPRPWIEEIESELGVPFIEAYGMTEAGPQIASNRLSPHLRKPGSVGRAAGPEVTILDDEGRPVALGETGEVAIRGVNVMSAYEDDPEANRAAFVGEWLRTGDFGYLDSDGHLYITGRRADVINRGGEKFSPLEIEEVLREHPGVAEAVAFSTPHPVLGQHVAAVVVPRRSAADNPPEVNPARLIQELRERVTARLAAFKAPHPILVAGGIPKDAGGKVRRRTLARHFGLEQAPAAVAAGPESGKPWTPVQRRVAQLWSEVLLTAPSGLDDNFFQCGGHSLAATRVMSRIREAFGMELPVECLFAHPTVETLSDEIGRQLASRIAAGEWRLAPASGSGSGCSEALPPLRRRDSSGPVPLSFAQQRLWFLDRVDAGPAYHMSASLRLTGPLNRTALQQALQWIRERHEVLRTVYPVVDGSPMQRVLPATHASFPVVELKAFSGPEREAEARAVAADALDLPFDLAEGPLMRTTLVPLSVSEHLLLVSLHHILFDGWSAGVFYRELGEGYRAAVTGTPPALPVMDLQYADVAEWQRQWLQGPALAPHLGYWRRQLRDAPPLCTFPADRPRPAVQTQRGGSVCRCLPPSVVESLRRIGSGDGSTLFMTVLAGFQALLGVYSGQDDCIVATPVANRAVKGMEGLIGFFANTLVLRTDLSGDPPFADLLQRVRRTTLDALAHQQVPFEKLVDELRVERDLGRMPFFQVMLVFQSREERAGLGPFPLAGGLLAQRLPLDRHAAKFDLTLYLEETEEGLSATWLYNADLFDEATICRIAGHYEVILERVAVDPRRPLSILTRLPEAEERRLVGEDARSTGKSVEPISCHRLLERVAASQPHAEAVVCGEDRLTYGELNARANRLARRLRREGVVADARVGVLLDRSVHALVAILAVAKAGGAFVGLDPAYPEERTVWMLNDAAAAVVIAGRPWAPVVASGTRVVLCLEELGPSLEHEDPRDVEGGPAPSDLAYVIYTSGSTGHPKGVMIPHSSLGHYVQALRETLGVTPEDRYLHTASLGFSSSVRQWAVPLCAGAGVVMASVAQLRDPQALFDLVRRERVTVVDLVPSYWRSCLDALRALDPAIQESLVANSLRLVLSASEPLPSSLPRDLWALLGRPVRMLNLFGQTETTGIVTAHEISPDGHERGAVVALGRPIPGMRIQVLDDHGRPVPDGVSGEMFAAGPGVGRGYLNRSDLTALHFSTDPFGTGGGWRYRTGDLGRRRSDGALEFMGRRDLQLKVRGVRVEPGEIEAVLREDLRVGLAAVVPAGVPGGSGVRLAAFVERVPGDSTDPVALAAELRSRLQRTLPAYMVPAFISVLERLPQTASGKLDRVALVRRADAAAGDSLSESPSPSSHSPFTAPRTPEERCLAEIWRSVLRVDRVGVDHNFFDLGGDSLLSVQVVLRAREAGLDLDLRQHFRNQTLSALSRAGLAFITPVADADGNSRTTSVGTADPGPAACGDVAAGMEPEGEGIRVTVESLRAFGREALEHAGLDPEGAATVAEVQLEASLRGQPTHHVDSIPRYAKRLIRGALNRHPRIRVERDSGFSAALDGDNGPGQWVAMVAMNLALEKAAAHGIGVVTVRRSNHLGAAGHYAWEAARRGWIGLCTTNGPVILAPTGGVTPTFGNNPLAVGIPAGRQLPVLLDIAMSVAPRGRIALQVARGQPLPPGWILDRRGRPSTELADLAAGLGVPIGGHKGYGLALILEILSGVLSGSGFGQDHGRELLRNYTGAADFGHFFLVLDPERFLPRDQFLERMDRLILQTKAGTLAEGTREILIPGESELRAREQSLREGVRLAPEVHRRLVQYGIAAGLRSRLVEAERVS